MTAKPKGRLSLRRNFSWILVGSMVENAAKWGMFVLLTKLVSPSEVGSFSLALAISTPITILAQLQLRAALITDAGDEHPFGAYRAMRMAAVVLSTLVVAAVGIGAYGATHTGALIALVGLSQAMTSLRDIWIALAQKHERMDVTATGNMIDGVACLCMFGIALLATRSVLLGVAALCAVRLCTLLFYDMPRAGATMDPGESRAMLWRKSSLRKLFWNVLPLGLTTAVVSLTSNIPQYFNEEYLGRESVAYFAAIIYFVFAARLVVTALCRAASPRLARLYRAGEKRRFRVLLGKLLLISGGAGAACTLVFALTGEHFLRIVYNEEYAAHADILVILMAAGAIRFVNASLGTTMTAARYFKIQPFVYGIVASTTLVACWQLIPEHHLVGAAWATVLVSVVNVLLNAGVVVHILRTMPSSDHHSQNTGSGAQSSQGAGKLPTEVSS